MGDPGSAGCGRSALAVPGSLCCLPVRAQSWCSGRPRRTARASLSARATNCVRVKADRDRNAAVAMQSENQLKVERAVQEQLAEQIKAIEGDNARLRGDLAFFESLLPAPSTSAACDSQLQAAAGRRRQHVALSAAGAAKWTTRPRFRRRGRTEGQSAAGQWARVLTLPDPALPGGGAGTALVPALPAGRGHVLCAGRCHGAVGAGHDQFRRRDARTADVRDVGRKHVWNQAHDPQDDRHSGRRRHDDRRARCHTLAGSASTARSRATFAAQLTRPGWSSSASLAVSSARFTPPTSSFPGRVTGPLYVSDFLELQPKAQVSGDVQVPGAGNPSWRRGRRPVDPRYGRGTPGLETGGRRYHFRTDGNVARPLGAMPIIGPTDPYADGDRNECCR